MLDKTFLINLDQQRNKTKYARVTRLDLNEYPLDMIEGRITSGSINIDGASAVRRTCSLSMVTDKVDISDYLWGLNTKFKLEIGVENKINPNYPDIIWFNQGVFINVSFSTALSTNNYTINLSGKDKMCQLNGENGGTLPFEVDFGKYEEIDEKGQKQKIYNTLHDIIREAVHHYGGEPFHNIIINDLENKSIELLEYKYDVPLYLFRQVELDENDGSYKSGDLNYQNGTLNADQKIYVQTTGGSWTEKTISELPQYDLLVDDLSSDIGNTEMQHGTPFKFNSTDEDAWCAAKIEYGQAAGYRTIDFIYNGELIAKAGETITSVLDKIKSMLGNYEYFYDVNGRFIFQEQKNYLNTAWTPVQSQNSEEIFVDPLAERTMYDFKDASLFTAFNNTPNLANVKNDYAIWGTRKGTGGTALSIHMRYAIDEKPTYYKSIAVDDSELIDYNKKYGFALVGQVSKEYTTIADYEFISNSQGKNDGYKTLGVFFTRSDYSTYPTHEEFFKENRRIFVKFEYAQNEKIPLKLNFSDQQENFDDGYGYPIWNNGSATSATNFLLWETGATKEFILKKHNGNWYWEANPAIDWREIIYQMALDYNKYNHLDDFALRVATANPNHYPLGRTGYEQYYVDMTGFWRELYDPSGAEMFEVVDAPTKDDIDKYYIKNDVYTKVTNLDEDNIPQVPTGTHLYKKVGNNYQRTYKGALGSTGDYYTLATSYDFVIPKGDENAKAKELLDSTQTNNVYEYDIDQINEGRQMYCIVSDKKDSQKTEQSATVTLSTSVNPIVISTQPRHTSFIDPDEDIDIPARVYCNAEGTDLKYQWYYKDHNYRTSSCINNIYSFDDINTNSRNNRQIYCKITDRYNNTISTDVVILTKEPIYFTKQLTNEHFIYKKNGSYSAGFLVEVGKANTDHTLTYEWYVKKPGEFNFKKSTVYGTNGTSGVAANKYGHGTTWGNAHNGYQIYCKVTNNDTEQSIISKVITLTQSLSQEANNTTNPYTAYTGMSLKSTLPTITFEAKDTKNKDVPNGQLIGGEKIDLTINNNPTSNSDIHYYWYVKKKDETNFSLAVDLVNTAEYSIGSIDSSYDGAKFYCVIEDAWKRCYVVDNDLTISFWPEFKITEQPKDASYTMPGPFLYQMPWAERNLLKYSQPPKGCKKNNDIFESSIWGSSGTIYEKDKTGAQITYGRPTYHEGDSSGIPYIRLKTVKGKNNVYIGQRFSLAADTEYTFYAKALWQPGDADKDKKVLIFCQYYDTGTKKPLSATGTKIGGETVDVFVDDKDDRVYLASKQKNENIKIKFKTTSTSPKSPIFRIGAQIMDKDGKLAALTANSGDNSLYLYDLRLEPGGTALLDYKEGYKKGFFITPGNCQNKKLYYKWEVKKPGATTFTPSTTYGTFGSAEDAAPNYYGSSTSFKDSVTADYKLLHSNSEDDTKENDSAWIYAIKFSHNTAADLIPKEDKFYINGRTILVTFAKAHSSTSTKPIYLNFIQAEGFNDGSGYQIYNNGKKISSSNTIGWEANETKLFTFTVKNGEKYWEIDDADLSKNYDGREYRCKVYDYCICAISNKMTIRDKSYQCWNTFIINKPETGLSANDLYSDNVVIAVKFAEKNDNTTAYSMTLNFPSNEGYKDGYGYYICKEDGSNHTNKTFTWGKGDIKYFKFKNLTVNGEQKKCWIPCNSLSLSKDNILFTTPTIKLRKQYTGGVVNNSYHKMPYITGAGDNKSLNTYRTPTKIVECQVKTSFDGNTTYSSQLEYQWYYKGINDTSYSKSTADNQTNAFKLGYEKIKDYPSQILVYCAIKDKKSGKIVNTNHALLSVENAPAISFKAIGINETTKEEVEQDLINNTMIWALGKEFAIRATLPTGYKDNTVKWFQKNSDESRFSEISQYQGTLKYGYDEDEEQYTEMTESISGREIYCTAADADGNKIQSNIITIRAPKALTAPQLSNRLKGSDNWEVFTVLKNNVYAGECETTTGLQYQWYEIKDDGSESKIANETSGTYDKATDCIKVFCEITDTYGQKVRTNTAAVRMYILDDPISQMSPGGNRATVEIWAGNDEKSSEANRYNWYYNPFDYSLTYYIPTTKFDYGLPWAKQIIESPETLNFWIDFLDTDGDLNKFSVKAIGSRPKVVNDKDVKAIYYRDIPDVYYSDDESAENNQHGKLQIPAQYASMFSRSAQGKSAKEAVDTQLYNHAHCIESVSITAIPIYYLEPNKRIYVNDPESGISGDYIVTKITVPLAYNGTMNLTATKAVDRIL